MDEGGRKRDLEVHIVERSDTLNKIALRYEMSVRILLLFVPLFDVGGEGGGASRVQQPSDGHPPPRTAASGQDKA